MGGTSMAASEQGMAKVTLQVGALLDQARAASGLTDFGDEWFIAPLSRLVADINHEAGLTAADAGPVQRIVQALQERLQMVDLLKRRPEIREERVEVAGAILGLPRTGSTLLQRLLGAAPQLTSGFWWEVTFPLPFPGEQPGDPRPRQDAARAAVEYFYSTWPEFRSIHPMDAMAQDEDVILLDKSFLSTTYDSMLWVPSYGFWMAEQDHEPAYRELLLWLQILQDQTPWRRGRKWILKSPHHLLGGLDGFLRVFPNARAIMTHRAIEDVLPSYCSMCKSITSPNSTTLRDENLGPYWARRFAEAMARLEAARAAQPAGRFIDVRYEDLTADPIGVASGVMQALGVPATDADRQAMQDWNAANGRDARPPHHYVAESFGLAPGEIARLFADYAATYLAARPPSGDRKS